MFEGSYSTWQEANARGKGYDNINDYDLYSPRDIDIAKKVIDTCRKIANKEEIPLRQSSNRTAPDLLRQASNRKSHRQKEKALKATRRIRTIGRAMLRELLRKMNDKQLKPHVDTLFNATSILFQQKYDKDKIYSPHEPHVECIAKGKAHKRYEFGTKVSIAKTCDSGVILGALWPCRVIPMMVIPLKQCSNNSNELRVLNLIS